VTVFGGEAPHNVNDHVSQKAPNLLSVIADTAATLGSNVGWYFSQSQLLLVHSGIARPDEVYVQPNRAGVEARQVTHTRTETFLAQSWTMPEIVPIPSAHGAPAPIYSRVYTPEGFDPSRTWPAVVFVHGWLANANLWRKVVPLLAERHRCIVPDLPLGAHLEPMSADLDGSPDGIGRLMNEFLDALGAGSVRPLVVVARCLPYGDGITWLPVADLLRSAVGAADVDDATAVFDERSQDRFDGPCSLGADFGDRFTRAQPDDRQHLAGRRNPSQRHTLLRRSTTRDAERRQQAEKVATAVL